MDRFSVEVDTKYFNDPGTQENVFNLSEDELKNRVVGKDFGVKINFFKNFQNLPWSFLFLTKIF